jgi:hypothetical protein
MSTLEKQMDLMRIIPNIENEAILDAIYQLITSDEVDIVQFTKEEEEQIDRGLRQVENNEVVSDEIADLEIQAWLED